MTFVYDVIKKGNGSAPLPFSLHPIFVTFFCTFSAGNAVFPVKQMIIFSD